MEPIIIDMNTYPRREHFEYFNSLRYPYLGVTVNVDITELMAKKEAEELPFFLTFLYHVSNAANAVPEFRQRVQNGGIVQYPWCPTSHTVALEDGTYCYCLLRGDMPFEDFLPYAIEEQERAKQAGSLDEGDDVLSLMFISTAPWFSYTSLVQPVPEPADSNPRITWGKRFEQDGRILLPVTVLCNHALADGAHLGMFYDGLRERLDEFCGIVREENE